MGSACPDLDQRVQILVPSGVPGKHPVCRLCPFFLVCLPSLLSQLGAVSATRVIGEHGDCIFLLIDLCGAEPTTAGTDSCTAQATIGTHIALEWQGRLVNEGLSIPCRK
jgi:hypothetical protein